MNLIARMLLSLSTALNTALNIRPAKPALAAVLAWLLFALLVAGLRIGGADSAAQLSSAWIAVTILLCLGFLIDGKDAVHLYRSKPFTVKRECPGTLSIGKSQAVFLEIKNQSALPQRFTLIEHLAATFELRENMPFQFELQAQQSSKCRYHIIANERGDAAFGITELRCRSRWQLWDVKLKIDQQQTVKVYPDFLAINR